MVDLSRSEIIKNNPIGEGLKAFRDSFSSTCPDFSSHGSSDVVERFGYEVLKNLTIDLFLTLQNLSAARQLPSSTGRGTLRSDLLRISSLVVSDDFEIGSVRSLFEKVDQNGPEEEIWNTLYDILIISTPPPRQLPYPYQTPISFNTSSFVNTSENRKQFDDALKDELDSSLYIDVPDFFDAFFSKVTNLEPVAEVVFRKCQVGKDPLYRTGEVAGWRDWPQDAKEEKVLRWFKEQIKILLKLAEEAKPVSNVRRRLLGQPSQALLGSTTQRKLDVGFSNDLRSDEHLRYGWSQILVPGELKSNPNADRYTSTWLDLAKYAREVLTAQDTRRFVLGFTLCGSIMRLWEFDRLGGIASNPFDINEEGLQFVSAVLGYLWMNDEQLGFDPTMTESEGKRYMKITRNGKTERLVILELMKRHSSVAGRATTCWKVYREGDEPKRIFVVKDSWQHPEREEEGELLREATEKGVINVARYFHHETVRVGGKDDDINGNVRKGLDVMKASNAFRNASTVNKTEGKMLPLSTMGGLKGGTQSRNRSISRKRSSSSLNAELPSSKRTCSSSPHKQGGSLTRPNRIHRRVILRDYGKNIHKANSRFAILAALEGNITGHESLREKTGIIQSDISIGNLMMNEEEGNPSWGSFLIDLDLAIRERRENPSGAPNKTGTRAFMAIKALYGEKRSFMDDMESVFWVLFWICIHYTGPNGENRVVPKFEKWNYADTEELAKIKEGTVAREQVFNKTTENFTPYFQPFVPLMKKLRRIIFPMGKPWENEDKKLYSQMREILRKAMEDLDVMAEWTG